jgi:hypothetical protein
MTYDCFLSHNSKDKPAVRALATRLADAGLTTFLDEEALQPGLAVQPQLEAGIRNSRSVAVLVGADGMGPWQDEEQQAALVLAVRDKRPVIPVLLPGAPSEPPLPMFLQNRHWVDLRPIAGNDTDEGFERLLRGITGPRPDPQKAAASTQRSKLSDARCQALRQQLTLLTAQWNAALQESAMNTGAAQIRADQQAEQLAQKIREIERQLDGGC